MFKEIFIQLQSIWKQMKLFQKLMISGILLFVAATLGFFLVNASSSPYIPLFPTETISPKEYEEIKNYLLKNEAEFEENQEVGILVLEKQVRQIRSELAGIGIPQQEKTKGFELFDSNTWIKGEKELQVLEMRALKGQLEKDLTAYDNIRAANVILDMAPPKAFGANPYKTKASVILTLKPGTRIAHSQLKAMTCHLAGAVRGLEPKMIAISDTTGKLYKAMDADEEGMACDVNIEWEERIQEKVDSTLKMIVGEGHFHTSVQALVAPLTQEIDKVTVLIIIDRLIVNESDETRLKSEIERHVQAVLSGYQKRGDLEINFISFGPVPKHFPTLRKEESHPFRLVLTLFICIVAMIASLPLFFLRKKLLSRSKESFQFSTRVNLSKLGNAIQTQEPSTIAWMLCHLDPHRAEDLLMELPTDVQEKVLQELSEKGRKL